MPAGSARCCTRLLKAPPPPQLLSGALPLSAGHPVGGGERGWPRSQLCTRSAFANSVQEKKRHRNLSEKKQEVPAWPAPPRPGTHLLQLVGEVDVGDGHADGLQQHGSHQHGPAGVRGARPARGQHRSGGTARSGSAAVIREPPLVGGGAGPPPARSRPPPPVKTASVLPCLMQPLRSYARSCEESIGKRPTSVEEEPRPLGGRTPSIPILHGALLRLKGTKLFLLCFLSKRTEAKVKASAGRSCFS